MARRLPLVQREIAKARDDTLKSVYADMAKSIQGHEFAKALPEKGIPKVKFYFIRRKLNDLLSNSFRMNLFKDLKLIEILKVLTLHRVKFLVAFIN